MGIRQVGIYLPLLVMDQLTIRRYAQEKAEKPLRALRRGIAITVGYGMVLLLVGFLREFLAAGTLLESRCFRCACSPWQPSRRRFSAGGSHLRRLAWLHPLV